MDRIRVGTAAWSLPAEQKPRFPEEGTHLVRYAQRLPAVEINTSFYRPHKTAVYEKWAASVPDDFRFAVKMPQAMSHETRLVDPEPALDKFVAEVAGLGDKLGCLLLQLPPSFAWPGEVATQFFEALRARTEVDVALEPRHRTWYTEAVEAELVAFRIGRVAADPPVGHKIYGTGGWPGFRYHRLHGAPEVYWSDYDDAQLDRMVDRLRADAAEGARVWCIFDNTAAGFATKNALDVMVRLGESLEG